MEYERRDCPSALKKDMKQDRLKDKAAGIMIHLRNCFERQKYFQHDVASVVDQKLFFPEPDPDTTLTLISVPYSDPDSNPDPDPACL
jgi:hypothetical protein